MVPPVLTCLVGRTLGAGTGSLDHYDLRDLAASLLGHLCNKYAKYSHNLKPRLARSCLKTFLDPKRPFGSHYGAILGLKAIGGAEVVRRLIVPNLKAYSELLEDDLQDPGAKKAEAEKVISAILNSLESLIDDEIPWMNGHSGDSTRELRAKLVDKLGETIGGRIAASGHAQLAQAVLDDDLMSL